MMITKRTQIIDTLGFEIFDALGIKLIHPVSYLVTEKLNAELDPLLRSNLRNLLNQHLWRTYEKQSRTSFRSFKISKRRI